MATYAQAYSLQASTSQSILSLREMTLKGHDIPVILAVHPAAQHSHTVPHALLIRSALLYLNENLKWAQQNIQSSGANMRR